MLVALIMLVAGVIDSNSSTFESDARDYRVQFPSKPSRTSSQSVDNASGQTHATSAELATPEAVYSLQVIESRFRINPNSLDDGLQRFAAANQGTVRSIRVVTVDGSPGRDCDLTENTNLGPKRSKLRWVVSGNTLFQLRVTSANGSPLSGDADRFLNSLEIGPAKGPSLASMPNTTPDIPESVDVVVKDDADDGKKAAAKPSAKPAPKKANAITKLTIDRIPMSAKAYPFEDLEDLKRSFLQDREGFRDVGPAGSILVGVRVSYIERFGGYKVRSAQPIYRSGTSHYVGRAYGEVVPPVKTFIARPGYAVGGLVTHTGLTVDGFGMVYMRVDGDRLDPDDSYKSPWIGDEKGGGPGEVFSKGGLVVGLQGRSGNELFAIGLVGLK